MSLLGHKCSRSAPLSPSPTSALFTHLNHLLDSEAFELATGIYTFLSKSAHDFGQKQYHLDQMNCNPKTCCEPHVKPWTVKGSVSELGIMIGSGDTKRIPVP